MRLKKIPFAVLFFIPFVWIGCLEMYYSSARLVYEKQLKAYAYFYMCILLLDLAGAPETMHQAETFLRKTYDLIFNEKFLMRDIYNHVSNNNPLLLTYYDEDYADDADDAAVTK